MEWSERIASYDHNVGFPKSMFIAGDGRVVGTFIMGNNYVVKSGYYGGYPNGYMRRIKALFPDRKSTLHLFSGMVNEGDTVDIRADLNPTYCINAHDLSGVPLEKYDLIMADPPYSGEDAEHYGTTMINRNKVMEELERTVPGTFIVWLDQSWPMYNKRFYDLDAVIGMIRSTNHRVRMIFIFRRRANREPYIKF